MCTFCQKVCTSSNKKTVEPTMENVTNFAVDNFTSLVTTIASNGQKDDTKYQCDLMHFVVLRLYNGTDDHIWIRRQYTG